MYIPRKEKKKADATDKRTRCAAFAAAEMASATTMREGEGKGVSPVVIGLLVAALAVIVLVLVIMGVLAARRRWRAQSALSREEEEHALAERFANGGSSDLRKHPKNQTYNAYFKDFYSNGKNAITVMFTPSVRDVACMQFEEDINEDIVCGDEEGAAPLDLHSVRDPLVSLGAQPFEVCASKEAVTEPVDHQDAVVRIMDGMYSLRKNCVQLPYHALAEDRVGEQKLVLPADHPATLFLFETRPVFLVGTGSLVYHVMFGDYTYAYGSGDEGAEVSVRLKEANEDMLYMRGSKGSKRRLSALHAAEPLDGYGVMNVTLYYLNYEHPVRRGLSVVEFEKYHVITAIIPLSRSLLASSGKWVDMDNVAGAPRFDVKFDSDENMVRVNTDGADGVNVGECALRIDAHGFVVVTYAVNSVHIAYLARGKMRAAKCGSGIKSITYTHDVREGILDRLKERNAAPPASSYPCTVTCVPNLYVLHRKLVGMAS